LAEELQVKLPEHSVQVCYLTPIQPALLANWFPGCIDQSIRNPVTNFEADPQFRGGSERIL